MAGAMLAQVLSSAGKPTICLPVAEGHGDALDQLSLDADDILFVSALPPFALLSSRTVLRRCRERFPEVTIILGLWNSTPNGGNYEERLGRAFGVEVVHSLGQAVARATEIRVVSGDRPRPADRILDISRSKR
jgi:hypothetical protein